MIKHTVTMISSFMLLFCLVLIFLFHPGQGLELNNYHFDFQTFVSDTLHYTNFITYDEILDWSIKSETIKQSTIVQKMKFYAELPTITLSTVFIGMRFVWRLITPFDSVWAKYENPLY